MAWLSSFFIATVLFSTYIETNSFTTIRPFIHRSSCTVLYARRSQRTMDSSLSALGLERGATMDDAKKAYRKAAMRTHPDRNDTEAAAAEFREVSEAYAFIAGKGSTAAGTEAVVEAVADLATDFASFARDVLKDVAVPLARDVAVPLAETTVKQVAVPFLRRTVAQVGAAVSGGSVRAASWLADRKDLQRRLKEAAVAEATAKASLLAWSENYSIALFVADQFATQRLQETQQQQQQLSGNDAGSVSFPQSTATAAAAMAAAAATEGMSAAADAARLESLAAKLELNTSSAGSASEGPTERSMEEGALDSEDKNFERRLQAFSLPSATTVEIGADAAVAAVERELVAAEGSLAAAMTALGEVEARELALVAMLTACGQSCDAVRLSLDAITFVTDEQRKREIVVEAGETEIKGRVTQREENTTKLNVNQSVVSVVSNSKEIETTRDIPIENWGSLNRRKEVASSATSVGLVEKTIMTPLEAEMRRLKEVLSALDDSAVVVAAAKRRRGEDTLRLERTVLSQLRNAKDTHATAEVECETLANEREEKEEALANALSCVTTARAATEAVKKAAVRATEAARTIEAKTEHKKLLASLTAATARRRQRQRNLEEFRAAMMVEFEEETEQVPKEIEDSRKISTTSRKTVVARPGKENRREPPQKVKPYQRQQRTSRLEEAGGGGGFQKAKEPPQPSSSSSPSRFVRTRRKKGPKN